MFFNWWKRHLGRCLFCV